VDTLIESAVPVQIVVGVNPGPALAVRDGTGVARFTRVVDALGVWANSQPSDSQDDLSLISLSGSLISHAAAKDWFVSLSSFKPEFRTTTPNLQSLTIALDTVNSPTLQSGMKRAVLFITPHMEDPNIDNTIAPLIQHAIDTKVRVFIWFVDGDNQFNSPSANAFRMLAQQTNGAFFAFSGKESFPDPNTYFDPLRHIYSLTYTSGLKAGGEHTVGLYVETPDGSIPALDKSFTVDVQPPDPIFLSPPLQITRQPPADDPYSEDLTPARQQIEVIVEFPDGHVRELERTTLYVDGQAVDQNISAPFETFTWDLSTYDSSATHEIVVEVEDVLGLKKSSMGIPISVTVIQPQRGIRALFGRYSSYIILGAIGLAGLLLLGILLRGRTNVILFRRRREARQRFEDPLTQPVPVGTEPPASATKKTKTQPRKKIEILQKPARVSEAPAYLIRLTSGGEPASAVPIPLAEKDMTFGTDPVQSKHVLDDPSISPLHARIKQMEDGHFIIYDHGSIAGTWVNYEPITREGLRLSHGDRIHFGQMSYRFDLSQPPAESEPKIVMKK
jgi:FHA domain